MKSCFKKAAEFSVAEVDSLAVAFFMDAFLRDAANELPEELVAGAGIGCLRASTNAFLVSFRAKEGI